MDGSGLAWIKPGDPRSELVLSLLKEGNGLPLLLNGISNPEDYKRLPDPRLVKAISPMAQIQDGRYKTPTYIVHGTMDEVVPYDSAVKFVEALRHHGVDCGFLTVEGVKHIHDLDLKPGTVSWEAQVAPAYEFLLKRLLD
jgi:acetyl esterase/lipase